MKFDPCGCDKAKPAKDLQEYFNCFWYASLTGTWELFDIDEAIKYATDMTEAAVQETGGNSCEELIDERDNLAEYIGEHNAVPDEYASCAADEKLNADDILADMYGIYHRDIEACANYVDMKKCQNKTKKEKILCFDRAIHFTHCTGGYWDGIDDTRTDADVEEWRKKFDDWWEAKK
ncbi:MAG: hypothetical protein NT038_09205 [Euryarchaeota archaeon]|nr:hypothetical protein [Euryarchaeota archaeon]